MIGTTRIQVKELLSKLIISSLSQSIETALFLSELLYSIDSTSEPSAYLLALSYQQSNCYNQAIHILRQPIIITTTTQSTTNSTTTTRTTRRQPTIPCIEATLRSATLYSQCCQSLNRVKEATSILSKAINLNLPITLSPNHINPNTPTTAQPNLEPWVLQLELARLARKSGEHDTAILGYRKVLQANAWCWEAIEALCQQGSPPNIDLLFPHRPTPPLPNPTAPLSPPTFPSRPLPNPAPLGPSQTFAVNSPPPPTHVKNRNGGDGLNFLTPMEGTGGATMGATGGGKEKEKGKGVLGFGGFFGKKGNRIGIPESVDMNVDDR